MLEEIIEGICNTLNTDLSLAKYRPANVATEEDNTVECAVKVMLGRQDPVSLGEPTKYDHYGWIYFDYGSNDKRVALLITQAMDELLDWQAANYEKGLGFDIGSGYYIRDMEHIPFQGYPKPRELFLQEMMLMRFIWERR